MRRSPLQSARSTRRGSTLPFILASLLVIFACMALILDLMWLEGVSVELRRTTEASALAGCRELASDDLLKTDADPELRVGRARIKAASIASENLVAGEPLSLVVDPEDDRCDVFIGKDVRNEETGGYTFLNTAAQANAVRVKGERTRSRWNPVALFFAGVSGQPWGDVVEAAQAEIDNHLTGLRPYDGVPVPALPIAILEKDPAFQQKQTWDLAIDQRGGADKYSFDAESNQVVEQPGGIPEIVLQSMPAGGRPTDANVMLLDLNSGLQTDRLTQQIAKGWTTDDLTLVDGFLDFTGTTIQLPCGAAIDSNVSQLLAEQIGQPRIVLLYQNYAATGTDGSGTLTAVRPVAGRIMAITTEQNGACRITFQPSVVTTRTAVLARESGSDSTSVLPNPYIYKLQLTR